MTRVVNVNSCRNWLRANGKTYIREGYERACANFAASGIPFIALAREEELDRLEFVKLMVGGRRLQTIFGWDADDDENRPVRCLRMIGSDAATYFRVFGPSHRVLMDGSRTTESSYLVFYSIYRLSDSAVDDPRLGCTKEDLAAFDASLSTIIDHL